MCDWVRSERNLVCGVIKSSERWTDCSLESDVNEDWLFDVSPIEERSMTSGSESVRPAIQAMRGYTPGEQPRVGKVIKLNTNENPFPPSNKVIAAIGSAAQGALQRYPDPVATAFRMEAARKWSVDPSWILCGNGSDDVLTILTRTFVGEGDLLRFPTPSYILYRTLAQIQGARVEEIPFESDWSLSAAFTRPDPRLRLVFLPNPNSPSGTLLSPSQIGDLAQQLSCPLVVDEAYADFATTNCVSLIRDHANVIVTRTLSKSYGLAGLRFGYLVARPELVEQMIKVKDSYNCDALSIAGATAALADEDWLRDNVAKVIELRKSLSQDLVRLGFSVVPSEANFVWCTHPMGNHKSLYEGLKSQGILVRYMVYEGWGDGLRISVGTADQQAGLVRVLGELLAKA